MSSLILPTLLSSLSCLPYGEDWERAVSRAISLQERGLYEDALPLARRAIKEAKRSFGPKDGRVAKCSLLLGRLLLQCHSVKEAQKHLQWSYEFFEQEGDDYGAIARSAIALSLAERKLNRLDSAISLLRRAVEVREKQLTPHHDDYISTLVDLAKVLSKAKRSKEAENVFEEALKLSRESYGRFSRELASLLFYFGKHQRRSGISKSAKTCFEEAMKILEEQKREGSFQSPKLFRGCADELLQILSDEGNEKGMIRVLERKIEHLPSSSLLACKDRLELARLQRESGRYADAEENLDAALKSFALSSRTILEEKLLLYESWGKSQEAKGVEEKLRELGSGS